MAKANEMVKEHEMALWKKLKEDNPIWGPPITDCGGYKKQTLFKDTTPKYSSLFSNSSEKQGLNLSLVPIVLCSPTKEFQILSLM